MNDLAKKDKNELATNATFTPVLDGIDSGDMIVPRAGLCQGTSQEQEEYPNVKRGTIYSKLLGETIDDPTFIVAKVSKTYTQYDESGDELIYRTDNRAEVDDADLEWSEDDKGNRIPPRTTTSLDFVLVFKGVPVPHIFSFKKTSFQAGRHLLSLTQMLGGRCFTFGEPKVGENSKKQKYLIPSVVPSDDAPTPEMISLARSVAKANVVADDERDTGEDIPI